jgi:hypothetical protein
MQGFPGHGSPLFVGPYAVNWTASLLAKLHWRDAPPNRHGIHAKCADRLRGVVAFSNFKKPALLSSVRPFFAFVSPTPLTEARRSKISVIAVVFCSLAQNQRDAVLGENPITAGAFSLLICYSFPEQGGVSELNNGRHQLRRGAQEAHSHRKGRATLR